MINFRIIALSGALLLSAACSSFYEHTSLKEAYADSFMIGCVTLWGLTDDSSWKNGYPVPGRTNYPLLWNRDYTPHKALKSILAVP